MSTSTFVNIRNATGKEIEWPIRLCLGVGLCEPAFQSFKQRVLLPCAVNGIRAKIKKMNPREVGEKVLEVWGKHEELGESKKGGMICITKDTPWGDVYMVVGRNRKKSTQNLYENVVVTFLDREVALSKIKDDKLRALLFKEEKERKEETEKVAVAI